MLGDMTEQNRPHENDDTQRRVPQRPGCRGSQHRYDDSTPNGAPPPYQALRLPGRPRGARRDRRSRPAPAAARSRRSWAAAS